MYVRTTQSKSLPGGRIAPALKAAAITAFLFAALTPVLAQEPPPVCPVINRFRSSRRQARRHGRNPGDSRLEPD
jgi:hypothetical protein